MTTAQAKTAEEVAAEAKERRDYQLVSVLALGIATKIGYNAESQSGPIYLEFEPGEAKLVERFKAEALATKYPERFTVSEVLKQDDGQKSAPAKTEGRKTIKSKGA